MRVATLRMRVATLRMRVATLVMRVATLRMRVATLRVRVATLRIRVGTLRMLVATPTVSLVTLGVLFRVNAALRVQQGATSRSRQIARALRMRLGARRCESKHVACALVHFRCMPYVSMRCLQALRAGAPSQPIRARLPFRDFFSPHPAIVPAILPENVTVFFPFSGKIFLRSGEGAVPRFGDARRADA